MQKKFSWVLIPPIYGVFVLIYAVNDGSGDSRLPLFLFRSFVVTGIISMFAYRKTHNILTQVGFLAVLIYFASLPLYQPHWLPTQDGGETHRHPLWEIGHIH